MKRVLFDTDILLDVLLKRQPHFAASATALEAAAQGRIEGYVAAHAVTTLAYLLQRQLGAAQSRSVLADLLARLHVSPATDAAMRLARAAHFRDFEDAVCHAAALEAEVHAIVTRNLAGFACATVPVVLPEGLVLD